MKTIAAILGFLTLVSMRCCAKSTEADKNTWTAIVLGLSIVAAVVSLIAEKSKSNKKP